MPQPTSYAHGTPSWVDLATPDPDAASKFYGELFGWKRVDVPTDRGTYSMMVVGDKNVAAIYEQPSQQRDAGVPANWTVFISVDDVDAAAAKVAELGGTMHADPFDMMDSGRIGIVQDPTGAYFAMWQAGTHQGAELIYENNTMAWHELNTKDPAAATTFYTELFDLEPVVQDMGDAGEYTTLKKGEAQVAGIMGMPPGIPDFVPSHWLTYFAVSDVDGIIAKAKEHGAQATTGPMDVEGVGRFAVLTDPQGGVFAVISMIEM